MVDPDRTQPVRLVRVDSPETKAPVVGREGRIDENSRAKLHRNAGSRPLTDVDDAVAVEVEEHSAGDRDGPDILRRRRDADCQHEDRDEERRGRAKKPEVAAKGRTATEDMKQHGSLLVVRESPGRRPSSNARSRREPRPQERCREAVADNRETGGTACETRRRGAHAIGRAAVRGCTRKPGEETPGSAKSS